LIVRVRGTAVSGPHILPARRRTGGSQTHRWLQPLPPPGYPMRHGVVEVAQSWLNRFRRLLIRWEQRAGNYLRLLQLAATLILYRRVLQARQLWG
jgi:hypothetical protein